MKIPGLDVATRTIRLLRDLPRQRHVPYESREELRARRDERVRETVRYAARCVPYYCRLFRDVRLDPRDFRTAEDLTRLPILEKSEVRARPEDFLSTDPGPDDVVPFLTSGSTGEPLTFYHDRNSLASNSAFSIREREVVRRLCGKAYRYRSAEFRYSRSTSMKIRDSLRGSIWVPVPLPRLRLSVDESVETVVEEVNAFRPDLMTGYGSYFELLFRMIAQRGLQMHRPKMLLYGADGMTDAGKRLIEREFEIPVHSKYNAVEAFKIGFTCECRTGYHLHEDLCHVRIVDRDGRAVPDGSPGQVVITNLVNRGTVLLNYRLGDIATRLEEDCDCGRTFSLLGDIQGRTEDVVFLESGRFVHPRIIWGVFKPRPEILRYQLIQHDADRFELKVVSRDEASYDRHIGEILAELGDLLEQPSIQARRCDSLEPEDSGKFRPVISAREQSA